MKNQPPCTAAVLGIALAVIHAPPVPAIDDPEAEIAEINAVYLAAAPTQETRSRPPSDASPSSSPATPIPSHVEQFKIAGELLFLADDARDAKNWSEAARLYQEALQHYRKLESLYPEWQPSVTRFRTVYCENQMTEMYKKMGKPVPTEPPPPPPTGKKPPETSREPLPPPSADTAPSSSNVVAAARALLLASEPLEARKILIEGLRRDPDNRTIRLLIGVAQCQSTNYQDAVHVLQTLIEDDPANPFAYLALGTARFGLGQLREARTALEKALEVNPGLSEAHYNLAHLLLLSSPSDFAAAREHYRKAMEWGAPPDPSLEKRLQPPADPKPANPAPRAPAPLPPLLLIQGN